MTLKGISNQFPFHNYRAEVPKTEDTSAQTDRFAKPDEPEIYRGGSLEVEVYGEDTQRDFVFRALYKHAEAAGLPSDECARRGYRCNSNCRQGRQDFNYK